MLRLFIIDCLNLKTERHLIMTKKMHWPLKCVQAKLWRIKDAFKKRTLTLSLQKANSITTSSLQQILIN